MGSNEHIGRWELGCIVFNSLVFKLFLFYPKIYVDCGGAAAWNTAIFSGLIFLGLLFVMLKVCNRFAEEGLISALEKKGRKPLANVARIFAVVYYGVSVGFATFFISLALKKTTFPDSPLWYTAIFIVGAAVITAICGGRAVRRMHSLCVFWVGVTLGLIAVLGFRYGDIYSLTPVFGKGVSSVYLRGLMSIFMYSDIVTILFLPCGNIDYSYKRTVMRSAILAVIINIVFMLSFSLNFPFELAEKVDLLAYPLTKGAGLGKFPIRLDVLYVIFLITSGILYLSLGFYLIINSVRNITFKAKKILSVAMCAMLCVSLCGCYDSSEVEERAYIIAVGIDKGENERYNYTFQISNPLEAGGSMGLTEKDGAKAEDGNKTVDNVMVESNDFYTAKNKLQSLISKKPDMSHIKLMVFGMKVAEEDAFTHSTLMLKDREVRPATNVCLVESAAGYLNEVKPTLEESTVRYYELFFRNNEMPYAPVTELKDFVGRSMDEAYDAVAPIVGKNGLSGMGIFKNGRLCDIADANEVLAYKLISGKEVRDVGITGEDGAKISSCGRPDIRVNTDEENPRIDITVKVSIKGDGGSENICNELKKNMETILYKSVESGSDIFGFGRHVKSRFMTENDWKNYNWEKKYKLTLFSANIVTKIGKNI